MLSEKGKGYQPECDVMLVASDWLPAMHCEVHKFAKQCFLLKSLMTLGSDCFVLQLVMHDLTFKPTVLSVVHAVTWWYPCIFF